MRIERIWAGASALLIAAAGLMSGCAADGVPAGSCTLAEECERGLICSGGTCQEAECESDGDCADGEVCLFVDEDGNYDPDANGFCSAVECEGDGDCGRGESCIDGICYEGSVDNSCECSDDCESGQICFAGSCRAPLTSCSNDCECVEGQTCVEGVCEAPVSECDPACGEGQTCVDGACQAGAACDPACGEGQTCVDGVCQAAGAGALCADCTNDDDCGGPDDLCVTVTAGADALTFCGEACVDPADCPAGFTCFAAVAGRPNQCRPITNSCDGCLGTGCSAGQYCDPVTAACQNLAPVCGACTGDAQCVSGTACATFAGANFCLTQCTDQSQCGTDEQCRMVGDEMLCAPASNSCGSSACTVTEASCTAAGQRLDADTCACVDCLADSECTGAGEICGPDGDCVVVGGPCERITDCPDGICDTRIGRCVQCLTPGDCAAGQVCQRGICADCECPVGQQCDINGACVDLGGGDPSSCTSDSECATFATELGYAGANARCDSGAGGVGCYIAGICNGAASGLPIDVGGFGGETDVFGASCAPGSTCNFRLDLLGGIGGGGSPFTFACTGCDPSDASTCREGESCTTPLIPIPDDTPSCTSGGGGGFPFPFP